MCNLKLGEVSLGIVEKEFVTVTIAFCSNQSKRIYFSMALFMLIKLLMMQGHVEFFKVVNSPNYGFGCHLN